MKKFITTKEAAEILGVNPLTLRRWDKNGKLKVARHPINNYRLYKPKDVKKLADKINKGKS
ncbi:MAG: helix-turn-helix domain-containing protein [Candidatus Pacebacteria bacterium]|nr:helix-turn-helix domain-containing protein [Candidatus Paceibacterota bacterium]